MTKSDDPHPGLPWWAGLATQRIITPEQAARALTDMELTHTLHLTLQREVATRLGGVATEFARPDLRRRAELVIADVTLRLGEIVIGSSSARSVLSEAEQVGDQFATARAYFLLAWVGQSIGDMATAQINGIRSVELLPEGTARGVLMDHLTILAIAYSPAPESKRYYAEALAIAREYDDPVRITSILNNMAFSASEAGNLPMARRYADELLNATNAAGLPLNGAQMDTVARIFIADGHYAEALAVLEPIVRASTMPEPEAVERFDLQAHALPLGLAALALAHRLLGDLDVAEKFLGQAEIIAGRDRLSALQAEVLRERALLHAARGEHKLAFDRYVAYHEAVLALQSEDDAARARLLHTSFEVARNREQAEHFRDLAMRDTLTGLFNRRYMEEMLHTAITEAARSGAPLSLAIIDADFFKRVNDEHSHTVGDEVLRVMAARMLAAKPDASTICRLGGEEFVLVMPGVEIAEAIASCETIRGSVAHADWSALIGSMPLTVSIGVTTAHGGHTSISALLADADRHLYGAKRSGRNRVMGDAAH